MFDIKICCDKNYLDIFKAYVITNNFDYIERDGLIFYVDTVEKFFLISSGLHKFYEEHKKQGMESIDFTVSVDDNGQFCITPVRYAEY